MDGQPYLSCALLAMASGSTIWLDVTAAGWGWFVDATPGDDSEFRSSAFRRGYHPAEAGTTNPENRIDLLTAIAHELGHLLGYEHSDDGTMHDPGAPGATGERHTPTPIVGTVGDRPQRVEPALFDLIFIEEKDKKTTWSSDRLAHELLSDLDLAPVR